MALSMKFGSVAECLAAEGRAAAPPPAQGPVTSWNRQRHRHLCRPFQIALSNLPWPSIS